MPQLEAEDAKEQTPLLGGGIRLPQEVRTSSTGKIYQYRHEHLLDWRGLFGFAGTAIVDRRCWIVVVHCFVLAIGTAAAVCLLLPQARKMEPALFDQLVDYFEVLISLLLAMYMGNAFFRWHEAVSCFKRILANVKQLMFNLRALPLRPELVVEIERLSIASCYVLQAEVHNMQMNLPVAERMRRWRRSMRALVKKKLLSREERQEMERGYEEHADLVIGVHSSMVWTWIGQVMRKLKGEPSVKGPMIVRLLMLGQECIHEVEEMKNYLLVQFPFIYVHMLCVSVHLVNMMVAVKCGISIGISLDGILSSELFREIMGRKPSPAVLNEFFGALQGIPMILLLLSIKPLLYQAVLVMAHTLTYPYGDQPAHMATETHIRQMEIDLGVLGVVDHKASLSPVRGAPSPTRGQRDDEDEDICCLAGDVV